MAPQKFQTNCTFILKAVAAQNLGRGFRREVCRVDEWPVLTRRRFVGVGSRCEVPRVHDLMNQLSWVDHTGIGFHVEIPFYGYATIVE